MIFYLSIECRLQCGLHFDGFSMIHRKYLLLRAPYLSVVEDDSTNDDKVLTET